MVVMRTLEQLAEEAMAVQNACNLSGVVHSFSRVMTELREILRSHGKESTDYLNRHPIAVLYSNKIGSMTGSDQTRNFADAMHWANGNAIREYPSWRHQG
jgi:hypothetical protein